MHAEELARVYLYRGDRGTIIIIIVTLYRTRLLNLE